MWFQCLARVLFICAFLDTVYGGFYNKDVAVTEKDPLILQRKWHEMEESMLTGVGSLVKNIMPMLTNPPESLVISETCNDALLQTVFDLMELKRWAVKMLDATGKPSGGQLRGTVAALGSYDECMEIRVHDPPDSDEVIFQGQYCLLDLRPILPENDKPYYYFGERMTAFQNYTPKTENMEDFVMMAASFYDTAYRFGLCIPSACSTQDLDSILTSVLNNSHWIPTINSCEVDKPMVIRNDMWIALACVAPFLLTVLVATIFDYYTYPRLAECPKTNSAKQQLILAFSIRRSVNTTLRSRSPHNPHLHALDGMKFLSITWVLLAHTFLFTDTYNYRDLLNVMTIVKKIEMQVICNAFLNVDTFFFVTGVITSYQILKAANQYGKNVFNIPIILARRIWKFLPLSMLVVGSIIWMPVIGSGPMWNYLMDPLSDTCRRNWWKVAIFINNFESSLNQCANHTWYLSVDFQFLVVGLLYIWIYFKSEKLGQVFLGLLVTFSVLSTAAIVYINDDTPIEVFSLFSQTYITTIGLRGYYSPNVHVGVFAMGLALGTFLSKEKKIRMSRMTKVVGWTIAFTLGLTAMYTSVVWNRGNRMPTIYAAMYSGYTKNAYGLALVWLGLVCTTGNGAIINKILSWEGFNTLNRFTFTLYLLHPLVMNYYIASLRGNIDFSNVTIVWLFLGHMVMSFIVAVFARILFECPLNELDMIIFNTKKVLKKVKEKTRKGEEDIYSVALDTINGCLTINGKLTQHEVNEKKHENGTEENGKEFQNTEKQ